MGDLSSAEEAVRRMSLLHKPRTPLLLKESSPKAEGGGMLAFF
jgi:hypothetical protein